MDMPGKEIPGWKWLPLGFNGQENSDEIAAGLTTALYWEYDSRIGRRWNMDPVIKVWESPYLCFGGNPIYLSDPLGDNATKGGGMSLSLQKERIYLQ
jgi:RHS repeat-associated protein